ncbi:MAG: EAL domain-containing protein [Erysipelotrichaceae bacterium]
MIAYKTILVVDDSDLNRTILTKILSEEYLVMEARNGEEALAVLNEHLEQISALMLDLVMPIMNGYEVLQKIQNDSKFSNLPIIVTTDNNNSEVEIKALTLGAWDFVSKPYNPKIIMFRLKNVIDRSQLSALKELEYLNDYDALTGIYNKKKFYEMTRKMLDENPDIEFVFLRFDVDRFQLINSFFGTKEGDKLLIYIAHEMARDAKRSPMATYGRIESDIVSFCIPFQKEMVEEIVKTSKNTLAKYNPNYDIVPSIGLYVIDDPSIPVEEMYNRATLAAKTCKGNYVDFYAYYDESMSVALNKEQAITNEMNYALENHQFVIYLQPQYNIRTNSPSGAEALVRWIHPTKGIISPNEFIPVFERNGFITKLDYYVWEQACIYLSKWVKQGIKPYPVSVNVSRVNIYNPKLVETMMELVNRYQLEPALLKLEFTESAYTDNPIAMKKTMKELQTKGFQVMMDDFGSGYSSLSLLKDIEIDILKIDMRFLSGTDIPGRGENIIASVIRMSKWLNIPVIVEGAETSEQVNLLRSVGCDYVQGFYFAQPMPVIEYEKQYLHMNQKDDKANKPTFENYKYDDLFALHNDMKLLFDNSLNAVAIYEFDDQSLELIRVNDAYYSLFGHVDLLSKDNCLDNTVKKEYRTHLLNSFKTCSKTHKTVECDYMRKRNIGDDLWVHITINYVTEVGNRSILIGELRDITMRRELNSELRKYREELLSNGNDNRTILIVDDAAINRTILKNILKGQFTFLEAGNGEEAITVLKECENKVDLILLDISMPIMDGKEFLRYKNNLPQLDGIPVIIITADDSTEQQVSTFSLGANDYLVKPFIPEVVIRRVQNILESSLRFKEMVKEYNSMSEQVKLDLMTGLINRTSIESMIELRLLSTSSPCVMMMVDIDNFKKINDTYGHSYGDQVIRRVANKFHKFFRKEDIIARMGGDEFAIFVENITNFKMIKGKLDKFCESVKDIKVNGINTEITCSVGVAISSNKINTFEKLYKSADKALYNAKCIGRNNTAVFGEESVEFLLEQWLKESENIFGSMYDYIYACDAKTHEILYINELMSHYVGMDQKSLIGKKCHEVLMHKDTPCKFCSIEKIKDQKIYPQLLQLSSNDQLYLARGKNILHNGLKVHLEIFEEVKDVGNFKIDKEVKAHGKSKGKC